MTISESLLLSKDEEDKFREEIEHKPEAFAFDCGQLPFERMRDDHFELLLADLYSAQADDGTLNWFDSARRLNDGADQGRDVILIKDSEPVGVIQCKRYKSNVGQPLFMDEICKFFLYAKIKPEIAPPLGQDFHYYVAVSDSTTNELFEFLTSSGTERFQKLRSEFEDRALRARNSSKKLSTHTELKDLTKEQLCDIIWARIDNLHTKLHKKDCLSRLVAKYPSVKSTYFKLDSDTGAVVEQLNSTLSTLGFDLSSSDKDAIKKIRTEYIDCDLCYCSELSIALLQGQKAMPFVRNLLNGSSTSLQHYFGDAPVLLNAGSEAANPDDWDEINRIVKSYAYPIVLNIGCGTISGETLLAWKKLDEMIWLDSASIPASLRRYKAGWCWVSVPSEAICNCYILVENEPKENDYAKEDMTLRLAFGDLVVWPTLGNDLTNPLSQPRSLIRRVMASQVEDKSGRGNFILAAEHTNSIDDILKSVPDYHAQRNQSPMFIGISNSSRLQGCERGIYSITGVFPASSDEQNTRPTPSLVYPEGRLMRRSCDGVTLLTAQCSTELKVSYVKNLRLLNDQIVDELEPDSLEFYELFERFPPITGYIESACQELQALNDMIQAKSLPNAMKFSYQAKNGVLPEVWDSLDAMSDSGENVMQGVHALSYIKSHENFQWVTNSHVDGHLEHSSSKLGSFRIMAWADNKYPIRHMEADLFSWARKKVSKTNLIVFADAKGRVNDKKPSHERHDITSVLPEAGRFTEAEEPQNVYIFDLGEVESCYDDNSRPPVEEFMEDIVQRRNKLDGK